MLCHINLKHDMHVHTCKDHYTILNNTLKRQATNDVASHRNIITEFSTVATKTITMCTAQKTQILWDPRELKNQRGKITKCWAPKTSVIIQKTCILRKTESPSKHFMNVK